MKLMMARQQEGHLPANVDTSSDGSFNFDVFIKSGDKPNQPIDPAQRMIDKKTRRLARIQQEFIMMPTMLR